MNAALACGLTPARRIGVSLLCVLFASALMWPVRHPASHDIAFQLVTNVGTALFLSTFWDERLKFAKGAVCLGVLVVLGHFLAAIALEISGLINDNFFWDGLQRRLSHGLLSWMRSDLLIAPLMLLGCLHGLIAGSAMLLLLGLRGRRQRHRSGFTSP